MVWFSDACLPPKPRRIGSFRVLVLCSNDENSEQFLELLRNRDTQDKIGEELFSFVQSREGTRELIH